jgi:uncharacterized membrane protein YdjX (TVP38/TMEM64 family)
MKIMNSKQTALENNAPSNRRGWKILTIASAIVAIQTAIDLIMGGEAEYFNAHATLTGLTKWIHGNSPTAPMIYREEELGMLALPLATAVLIGVPMLVATLIVQAGEALASRKRA